MRTLLHVLRALAPGGRTPYLCIRCHRTTWRRTTPAQHARAASKINPSCRWPRCGGDLIPAPRGGDIR